jgi:hypothetical protein
MRCIVILKERVATFPFSKTSFSAKMQPRIFLLVDQSDFLENSTKFSHDDSIA